MRNGFIGILIAIVVLVGYWSTFIVNPAQQALIFQFGEVTGMENKPGLKFKYPWQNVVYLDKRILNLNMPVFEPVSSDKKRLLVDAFARYRISDPVKFYQSVNNVDEGSRRLSTFLQSALRDQIGKATFTQVVRDERSDLMESTRKEVENRAKAIGVDVIDVKIRRADLPETNSQAIYARMQTERQREATEIRAQGEEQARRIRSRADRDATVIVANAQRDADIIRGDGDAERNSIFAEAYGKDKEFFEFYRSMQAYEESMKSGDTSMVLSPDSEFFRYFKNAGGAVPAKAPATAQ
ncbi:protease modulator HflC [Flexibacterium corallicola]|uniref:protease modulator HflC n=1 Tax=Flexibacterium corallicola TaxID=3037259 RepID=UPI00286FA28D|nr:protease modulator HflC [Pseudovibrio sp. M1P-2-3]